MEESWLKFYVNPFANLVDDEKVRGPWYLESHQRDACARRNLASFTCPEMVRQVTGPLALNMANLAQIQLNFKDGVPGRTPTFNRYVFKIQNLI